MTNASGIVTERAIAPERFAIAGVTPRLAARPRDRDELCEIVRAAARDGLTIVPWGGGTAIDRMSALSSYDLALDLTGLDRVVEYVPEDLTLTAECGVTIATLGETLAARGQELPLEAAHAKRATLGGVLAANASGPRRLRFGSPRDRILGARFVLGDGTLARTGGKVVKNVAGYGIHRMLCGSRGGLAIVVDASLKLLPAPAARAALIYEFDAATIGDTARWAAFAREEPAVLTVVSAALAAGVASRAGGNSSAGTSTGAGGHVGTFAGPSASALPGATGRRPYWVVLGLEDESARIAELRALAVQRLGEPALELAGEDVATLWQQLADLQASAPARLTFTGARLTPAALAPLFDLPQGASCVFHAACGQLHVLGDPHRAAEVEPLLAMAGFARIDSSGISAATDPASGTALLALRQRIRAALDPDERFALGERWVHSSG